MHSRMDFFLSLIPFFWIFVAFTFLGFSFFGMSHTKKGYKYSSLSLWGGSMLLSIFLGSGVYALGYAEKIEHIVAKNIAIYHGLEDQKKEHWNHPKQGFLSGEISEISESEKIFLLHDWKNNIWEISYKNAEIKTPQNKTNSLLKKGEKIKIRGKISDPRGNLGKMKYFEAEEIRGWEREHSEKGRRDIHRENERRHPRMMER